MAINFPSSPNVNDTHTHSGKEWTWNGTSWVLSTSGTGYTLPIATSGALGGIKVGSRLTINSSTGVLDADVQASSYGDSDVDTHLNSGGAGSGEILQWNGSDYAWVAQSNTTSFTALTDTPNSLSADQWVKVNVSGTALEFTSAPSGGGYSNSDVDTHLNQSNPTNGYVLSWNGSDYAWVAQTTDTNTTYSLFSTSADGLAPTLPAAHGGKFLKADGSWEVPAYTTNTNDNDYVNSLAFNTSTGVLTAGRTGSLADLTVDLDGKYAESGHTHTYQAPLTFSTGITNTSNTVTIDAAVQTTINGSGSNTNVFTIETIALNSFRVLEYTINVRHSTGIQAQKLLVMCDGTNHHYTEYGVMYSAALLGTFSTSTSGSNVLVRFDPVNTSTTIDFIKQVIKT